MVGLHGSGHAETDRSPCRVLPRGGRLLGAHYPQGLAFSVPHPSVSTRRRQGNAQDDTGPAQTRDSEAGKVAEEKVTEEGKGEAVILLYILAAAVVSYLLVTMLRLTLLSRKANAYVAQALKEANAQKVGSAKQ